MASYNVFLKRSAAKELESLPLKDRRRVTSRIQELANDPRPPGCEKLSGEEKYRVRQGNYRVLYEIDDQDLIVAVVRERLSDAMAAYRRGARKFRNALRDLAK